MTVARSQEVKPIDHNELPSDTIISVLTCAPGQELYSTFGHCAIRVVDKASMTDMILNYGTFNFDTPNFYGKFVRGQLDFELAVQTYDQFMYEYQVDQRSVKEQVLQLDPSQKYAFVEAIKKNLEGNNRYYKYDFLRDNCATRPRDIIYKKVSGIKLTAPIIAPGTTSRDLLYYYLDNGGQAWSKLGIDILLGADLDMPIDDQAAMFLPEFLGKAIANSQNDGVPLVSKTIKLIDVPTPVIATGKYIPLCVVSLVCILFAMILYVCRKNVVIVRLIDAFLLYVSGLFGILLLFMWFGTDHKVCGHNYNLLWAIPTNFIVAFLLSKKFKWVRYYFTIVFFITIFLLAFWFWLPQTMNIALVPFVLLMLWRYSYYVRKK